MNNIFSKTAYKKTISLVIGLFVIFTFVGTWIALDISTTSFVPGIFALADDGGADGGADAGGSDGGADGGSSAGGGDADGAAGSDGGADAGGSDGADGGADAGGSDGADGGSDAGGSDGADGGADAGGSDGADGGSDAGGSDGADGGADAGGPDDGPTPGGPDGGGDTPTPETIIPACTLTASATTITPGQSVTLTWTSSNVTSGSINQGVGNITPVGGGSVSVTPPGDITYTATFTGPNGTVTCAVSIDVQTPSALTPACTLTASATTINPGQTVVLTWTSSNVTSGTIDQGVGAITPVSGGSVTVTPPGDITYTATFTGPNGTVTCAVSIDVQSGPITIVPACTLNANPTTIEAGQNSTLTWTSTNVTSGSIDQGIGNITPVSGGSVSVSPTNDTTYTATFTGPNGTVTCSASINLDDGDDGGGGGGGGGGRSKPRVTLTSNLTSEPLTFVNLTQVPYTGFPAGPVTTALFWTGLIVWSGLAAYFVSVKGVGTGVLGAFMARIGLSDPRERMVFERAALADDVDTTDGMQANHFNADAVYYNMSQAYTPSLAEHVFSEAQPAADSDSELYRLLNEQTDVPPNLPTGDVGVTLDNGSENLYDVLENDAYREGVLLSAEGMRYVADRGHNDRTSAGALLRELIVRAREAYPREDGWLHLNRERITALLGEQTLEESSVAVPRKAVSSEIPVASVAPVRTDVKSAVAIPAALRSDAQTIALALGWLCDGKADQLFDLLRQIKLQGQSTRDLLTRVIALLDEVYRQRLEGGRTIDAYTLAKTGPLSVADLEALIELLDGGADYSYKDAHTGVKTAFLRAAEHLVRSRQAKIN